MRVGGRFDWQPKRYISRDLAQKVEDHVVQTGTTLRGALRLLGTQASATVADKLNQLGDTIQWLATALPPGRNREKSAVAILRELEERLGYRQYLEEDSGFAESGAARADTVTAFLDYAEGKGTLIEFLQKLRQLAAASPANRAIGSNRIRKKRSRSRPSSGPRGASGRW
ncbi:MAG: hypothetical protein R2867_36690 [Caldilineaceae bacterium]